MEGKQQPLQIEEATTSAPKLLENQLVATKFFMPIPAGTLISRPRLTALLHQSLKYPLTLVSAPAGFGKTTLLSAWGQSLPARTPKFSWISLDEEDNDPQLFWIYVLTALNRQLPQRFTPLLTQLQLPQPPSLKHIIRALINVLTEETEQFLLILDDYHLITEQQVHTTLSYLIEHIPTQLHIILSTRVDLSMLLPHLRVHQRVLEVRTDQLRCTTEETKSLFKEVMGIQLSDETTQEVTVRTEGWLVGLQLLGLSLREQTDPLTIVQEITGDQHYILDYLTEEVLRRQPQDVQTFLLSTCILERLTASLCNAVTQQVGSQQMLEWLERANLFVVPLDSKRQWYRYHALFAQALCYQLERMNADLVLLLHHRASLWYAQHDQITQAILHALHAHEWQWAADLIEHLPLMSFAWGASEHTLVLLQQWLGQLPADVVGSRPHLCLACTQMLWTVAPHTRLLAWLNTAEAKLTASLTTQISENVSPTISTSELQQDQQNLLGEVIAFRAFLQSYQQDAETALPLCQQALSLLSAENYTFHGLVAHARLHVYYDSSANNSVAAIESGLQASSLIQTAGLTTHAIGMMGVTVWRMIGAGRLHEAYQLILQAIQLGMNLEGPTLPELGWSTVFQAEILRERDGTDTALTLAREAISLCEQTKTIVSLLFLLYGYAVLLRIYLSRGELDEARTALQQFDSIGMSMNQTIYLYHRSYFTTIDQVRLWLACGELDHAMRWAKELDLGQRYGSPFVHEREEVAYARVFLAMKQPDLALQRLEPVLTRATAGQRWGHVIEIWLLQSLAHHMRNEAMLALSALSEALRLAEPEGYIRSFVDEGSPMEALLYRLRQQNRKLGPTPYLDMLLAAFQQESIAQIRAEGKKQVQTLLKPLSERELQILQLIAQGASNQEIAQKLVIVIDTVKRHVSNIFSKLGVQNRVQAVRQAQAIGLLGEEL